MLKSYKLKSESLRKYVVVKFSKNQNRNKKCAVTEFSKDQNYNKKCVVVEFSKDQNCNKKCVVVKFLENQKNLLYMKSFRLKIFMKFIVESFSFSLFAFLLVILIKILIFFLILILLMNLINAIIIKIKVLLYMTLSNCKIQAEIINLKFVKKIEINAKERDDLKKELKFINTRVVISKTYLYC